MIFFTDPIKKVEKILGNRYVQKMYSCGPIALVTPVVCYAQLVCKRSMHQVHIRLKMYIMPRAYRWSPRCKPLLRIRQADVHGLICPQHQKGPPPFSNLSHLFQTSPPAEVPAMSRWLFTRNTSMYLDTHIPGNMKGGKWKRSTSQMLPHSSHQWFIALHRKCRLVVQWDKLLSTKNLVEIDCH